MGQTFFRTHTRDDGETEFTCEIEVVTWGGPATWDDPAEGPEVDLVRAWIEPSGEEITLTDAEWAKAEQQFLEDPPEADYGDDY